MILTYLSKNEMARLSLQNFIPRDGLVQLVVRLKSWKWLDAKMDDLIVPEDGDVNYIDSVFVTPEQFEQIQKGEVVFVYDGHIEFLLQKLGEDSFNKEVQ